MPRSVYFLSYKNRIKIGVANNVEARTKQIRTHLLGDTNLLGSIESHYAYALEAHLHKILRHHWIKNEWFRDCEEVRHAADQVLAGGDLGFRPSAWEPARKKKKAALAPTKRTPEEWLAMVNRVISFIWPGDPVSGLAKSAEISREEAASYLTGRLDMPRPIQAILATEVLAYCSSGF